MNLANTLLHDDACVALIDGSEIYSHAHLKDMALRISNALAADDVIHPGDRVALLAHNSTEFVVSYLAILCAGATAVPIDPLSSEAERARDLSLIKPHLVITSSTQGVPAPFSESVPIIEFHSPQWREFLASSPGEVMERTASDIAVMMMTAGSSFQPRPAMLTHGSLMANLEQASRVAELVLDRNDVVLGALPMYHIFGLHVVLGFSLYSLSCVVIARTFDAIELAHLINHHEISVVPGVPALFEAFTRNRSVTIDAMTHVRMYISGGAPMRLDVRDKFHERFGANIAEGYGLTEASPMVSFTAHARREGDIGESLPDVEIDIRDSSGSIGVVGDAGQIVVKGPNVFAGYYSDRDATSRVLDSNGWLFTGDIGVRNEDGSISLVERSNDVIVVNGFSVFPSEVETVLLHSDLIDAASVFGELHEECGEVPVAYIVLVDKTVDADDPRVQRQHEKIVRDHCQQYLARYKVPVRFEFVTELSLKASSRPLRKSLRSALTNIDG